MRRTLVLLTNQACAASGRPCCSTRPLIFAIQGLRSSSSSVTVQANLHAWPVRSFCQSALLDAGTLGIHRTPSLQVSASGRHPIDVLGGLMTGLLKNSHHPVPRCATKLASFTASASTELALSEDCRGSNTFLSFIMQVESTAFITIQCTAV